MTLKGGVKSVFVPPGTAVLVRLCFRTLLASAALVYWPPVLADTLGEAMLRALASLPEMRAARASRSAVEESARQARGAWLPSIDVNIGTGRETSNNPNTRAVGGDRTLARREAAVNLSQLLFDGGATDGQIHRFEARAHGANDFVATNAENTALRAGQSYLDVIRLRELVALGLENEKRHQETLAQVSRLAEVGQGRRVDAQQAEARLSLAQASLSQLRGQLAQANAMFRALTGQAPGLLATVGSFQETLPLALADAIDLALQAHPAVRSAQQELLAAQADRDSTRSRFLAPRISLEVGQTANSNIEGIQGLSAERYAMIRLRYNLFRGGIDDSRIAEAHARVDEALANLGRARNDVEREMRQAWEGLTAERVRLPQVQSYAVASAQVVTSYRAQFTIAQRTLLDVLNAENELFTARNAESSSRYAVAVSELRVLAAIGRLLPTLGINNAAAPGGAEIAR